MQNKHMYLHASSGIRIRNPSGWAGEDTSYLRSRDHYDRKTLYNVLKYVKVL
jgi:hypothetical protein